MTSTDYNTWQLDDYGTVEHKNKMKKDTNILNVLLFNFLFILKWDLNCIMYHLYDISSQHIVVVIHVAFFVTRRRNSACLNHDKAI